MEPSAPEAHNHLKAAVRAVYYPVVFALWLIFFQVIAYLMGQDTVFGVLVR